MSKEDFEWMLAALIMFLAVVVLVRYEFFPGLFDERSSLPTAEPTATIVNTPRATATSITTSTPSPRPTPTLPSLGKIPDFSVMVADIAEVTIIETRAVAALPAGSNTEGLPEGVIQVETVVFQRGVRRCRLGIREVESIIREVADEFSIPHEVALSLWMQESRLSPFIEINGSCGMIRNSAGAYCAAQIYRPQGAKVIENGVERTLSASELVHAEYSVSQLEDVRTCFRAGAQILVNKPGGNWNTRVAYYQGFGGNTSDPKFINGYLHWLNAGGVYDAQEDVYITW